MPPNQIRSTGLLRIAEISAVGSISSAAMSSAAFTSDRKSTRLNSSHVRISYAVFCLKKKKQLVFGIEVCQPNVFDKVPVQVRFDFGFEIFPVHRLDVACDLQRNARALFNFYREMCYF